LKRRSSILKNNFWENDEAVPFDLPRAIDQSQLPSLESLDRSMKTDGNYFSHFTIAKIVTYIRSRFQISLTLIDFLSLKLSYCF
jgi:hypothetical protein